MQFRCILAGAFIGFLAGAAQGAPTLSIVPGGTHANGHLDANGNWVWRVEITPSEAGAELETELGFRETATNGILINAANANPAVWHNNPGSAIWGWELPGTSGMPEGVQTNCAQGCTVNVFNDDPNSVFSALGSIEFVTGGAKPYLTIVTRGPATGAGRTLTTNIAWRGNYGAGSTNGRITEVIDSVETNYDTFAGSVTYTAGHRDVNLDGQFDGFDITPFLLGFQAGSGKWFDGDLTGDGLVNGFDTTILLGILESHGAAIVPEPTTIWLCALLLGAIFSGRRMARR
jgi:hypothetical protein